jgi:predicted permease
MSVRGRLRAGFARLIGLFSGRGSDAFRDELESTLQMHIDEGVDAGLSPAEARRHALIRMGGIVQTREAYRDRRTYPVVEHFVQDARFAIRQLAKAPGFAVTAMLMLALGIGASVAIFAFVDAAILRPLPYPDPSALVDVAERTAQIPRSNLSYQDFLDWQRQNRSFSRFDVYTGGGFIVSTPAGSEPVPGARVSAGFFRTLGVAPALGRDFRPGEDSPEAPRTVILSHGAWLKRYGGRPEIVGETITLNRLPYSVIGVLPETFQFAPRGSAEFWTPVLPNGGCESRRSCHNLYGVARLKSAVTVAMAMEDTQEIARQLERQYPDSNRGQGALVRPLSEAVSGDLRPLLYTLLWGSALLLLIACINVASLLLVRAESRRREIAVRSALGASRWRLVAQFVSESAVLVAAGAAAGLVVARWTIDLCVTLIPEDLASRMPFLDGLGLSPHAIGFAAAIAVTAMVLFALTPAAHAAGTAIRSGLADGGRGAAGTTWRRLGFKLVVVELATAVVLLVGAGLLGKSLYQLLNVELGFRPERLASVQVFGPPSKYDNPPRRIELGRQVLQRASELPGVESAAITSVLPVSFNGNTTWIRFVGRPYDGEHNEVNQRDVSHTYFGTVGATFVKGRDFTEADRDGAPRVVIVNEALARKYYSGTDPVGQRIGNTTLTPDSITEIVGVVADIHDGALDADLWPAVYYPLEQSPDTSFAVIIRTTAAPALSLPSLVTALRQLDPDLGTSSPTTIAERILESPSAYLKRSSAALVGGFAALALLLGVIGLYGVIAYSVGQRTREIGVRLAMGAAPGSVHRMVLREAVRLAVVGIGIGLCCAVGAAAMMKALLFGTAPWDVPTLAGVAVILLCAALLASYIPARRASLINPTDALRAD